MRQRGVDLGAGGCGPNEVANLEWLSCAGRQAVAATSSPQGRTLGCGAPWLGPCWDKAPPGSMILPRPNKPRTMLRKQTARKPCAPAPLRARGVVSDGDCDLHLPVVVFSTWRQMAGRLPREGRNNATKPAHAVPLASARQNLDVETQAGHSPERAVEGPLECEIALGSQPEGGSTPERRVNAAANEAYPHNQRTTNAQLTHN